MINRRSFIKALIAVPLAATLIKSDKEDIKDKIRKMIAESMQEMRRDIDKQLFSSNYYFAEYNNKIFELSEKYNSTSWL